MSGFFGSGEEEEETGQVKTTTKLAVLTKFNHFLSGHPGNISRVLKKLILMIVVSVLNNPATFMEEQVLRGPFWKCYHFCKF